MPDDTTLVRVTTVDHRWSATYGDNLVSYSLLVEGEYAVLQRERRPYIVGSSGTAIRICGHEAELEAGECGFIASNECLEDGQPIPGPLTGHVVNGTPPRPEVVLDSYADAFAFARENRQHGRPGLRPAQLGAIHAVLAHWTSGSHQPATIVMPTGTGKTDTMVALLVAGMVSKLLILVPSDALRSQIAEKFLRLGVCQASTAVSPSAIRPVVGLLRSGQMTTEEASGFLDQCTVIVATPHALGNCSDDVRRLFVDQCSHLFVDEAHHVAADSWQSVVRSFADKPVLQFTATPYREDKKRLGGKLIYTYPLRLAQEEGVFSRINYVAVQSIANPDRKIAQRAVRGLDDDLARGFDHLLMARVRSVARAKQILELYQHVAPGHDPILIHSELPQAQQAAAVQRMRDRSSRVIVCVDMLGEGFDLPELKVAAIHDPHKSLGITLQFIGRFARPVSDPEQAATVVVARPEGQYDVLLRDLFAEDADWDRIIRDLSEVPIQREEDVRDFETGFSTNLVDIAIRSLSPSLSAVVFRTGDRTIDFDRIVEHFGKDNLVGGAAEVNEHRAVAWFIARNAQPVGFGNIEGLIDSWYELFVVYWDRERHLLYIHGSRNAGHYEWLTNVLAGTRLPLVTGDGVYRVMSGLERPQASNMGVLDSVERNRKFMMVNGTGVTEGFSDVEARGKVQTNIYAQGFTDGKTNGFGASLKGRIWSHRNASVLLEWVEWCDGIGTALLDESVSVETILRRFLRPKAMDRLPEDVPLGIDWNHADPFFDRAQIKVTWGGGSCGVDDVSFRVTDHEPGDTLRFDVLAGEEPRAYTLRIKDGRMVVAAGAGDFVVNVGKSEELLSQVLTEKSVVVYYTDEGILTSPNLYAKPLTTDPVLDPSRLVALDWGATDIRVESRGNPPKANSIQERMARLLLEDESWQVIIDDDRAGEIADLVAIKVENDELVVGLVHCKFSSKDQPGARVGDLYEVCGQAIRSGTWSERTRRLYARLNERLRSRHARTGDYGFIRGTEEDFLRLLELGSRTRTHVRVSIAQPGLSQRRVNKCDSGKKIIELLAGTEHYVRAKTGTPLTVYCSS